MISQPRTHDCRISEFNYKGHTIIFLENRCLRIGVLLSKGADIMEFRYKPLDIDFLWRAHDIPPLGNHIPTAWSQTYGNYLDFWYGGWQESLPSGLGTCTYKNAEFGIHGEVSLLPWEAHVLDDTPEKVSVRFRVKTLRSPFRLTRIMTLEKEQGFVTLDEELCNEGEEAIDYIWGHHPVFGSPFLEEGCVLDFPGGKITPPSQAYCEWARYAPGQEAQWPHIMSVDNKEVRFDVIQSKEARTEDIACVSDFPEGWIALRNPRLALGFYLVWDKDVFPYIWNWQAYGGSYNYPYYGRAYCCAIEPFSSPLGNLPDNVEKGTAKKLEAAETIETTLIAGAFTGSEQVTGCSIKGAVSREG